MVLIAVTVFYKSLRPAKSHPLQKCDNNKGRSHFLESLTEPST